MKHFNLQGYKLNTKRKKIQIVQAPYKGVTMSSAHITLETFKEKKENSNRMCSTRNVKYQVYELGKKNNNIRAITMDTNKCL